MTASMQDSSPLRRQWDDLWRRLHVAGETIASFKDLLCLYGDPRRHYHNVVHLQECLDLLSSARHLAPNDAAVEAALWFHDAVYEPTRRDNEEQSADLAAQWLIAFGIGPHFIDEVRRLILATRHAESSSDADEALIIDIDLAILGQSPERFDEYERAIRREYAHVSEVDFRSGRAAILRGLIARPAIYGTGYFRTWLEQRARENLSRSIAKLEV